MANLISRRGPGGELDPENKVMGGDVTAPLGLLGRPHLPIPQSNVK
jgi:hypothetical protein